MMEGRCRWTAEAEAGVRQVFGPWHAASKKGAVSRADLRQLLQRLQPGFSDGQLDEILACGSRTVDPNDDVDLHFFLDWVFHPGEGAYCLNIPSSSSRSLPTAGPFDGTTDSPNTAPVLQRAVTEDPSYAVTEEAPALQRAVTAVPNEQRIRRGNRLAGVPNLQPATRRASRGALLRAQELFQQRLGAGAVQMTDQMLLRLTRATSSTKNQTIESEEGADAPLDADFGDIGHSDSEACFGAEVLAPRFGEGAASTPSMTSGSCGVCWEEVQVGSLCGLPSCRDRYCAECMRRHAEVFVESSFYAMPWLKCPGCARRVPTGAWLDLVSEEQRKTYLRNGEALHTFRCPNCHEVGSCFKLDTDKDSMQKAEAELREYLSCDAYIQLDKMWARFSRAEESAESFATTVMELLDVHLKLPSDCVEAPSEDPNAFPPKLAWAQSRLLTLVEDPERRCCFQLALLRTYPKIRTPCCNEKMCFKCKVSGWHPEEACEDRQRKEMSKDVQFCPKCGVPTVKSEGCDHIICVCGASWQWQGNPVANAIQTARTEVIEELLNGGFAINSPIDEEAGETFLHYAARFRVLSMVDFLLDRGADPTIATTGGSTVLMEALSDSHAEGVIPVVKALVAARADVNARADYVSNSLFFVLDNWERYYGEGEQHRAHAEEREKGVPLVQLLLSARADVNQRQFLEDQGDEAWNDFQEEEEEEEEEQKEQEEEECESDEEEGRRSRSKSKPQHASSQADENEDRKADASDNLSSGAPKQTSETQEGASHALANEGGNTSGGGGSGPTALLLAIQRRLPLLAATIMTDGDFCAGGLDIADDSGNRPLYLAVSNRSLELVEQLLAFGASVNAPGPENTPPLHEALRAGHEPMAELLINSSADANATDDDGLNALHCALQVARKFDGSKLEAAISLAINMVTKVDDINLQTASEETALGIASAAGLTTVVSELLRLHALVDKPTKGSCTALGFAAEEGQYGTVQLLLEGRAIVEAQDDKGWTALHRVAGHWSWQPAATAESSESIDASPSDRLLVLKALLEANAQVDALSTSGLSPLLVAVSPGSKTTNSQLEVVDALLEHRANANIYTASGATPLALACEADASKIVERLLDMRADPNVMDSRSGTSSLLSSALERAAKKPQDQGSKKTYDHPVERLIRAGASVNATDKNGRTPIIALIEGATALTDKAAADFDEEADRLLGLLTEAGATLELAPASQQTALEIAARAGRLPLVQSLLRRGASVNSTSAEGSTPLLGLCTAISSRSPNHPDTVTPFLETGSGQVLQELLNARADVLAQDRDGNTPITVIFSTPSSSNNQPVLANAPAMALLLRAVPEGMHLEGDRWKHLLIEFISLLCAPSAPSAIISVLEVLLPKVKTSEVTGANSETLLDLLISQMLFSANLVLKARGADIERFNTEYRYNRQHNTKPLFKSASGAIMYWGGTPPNYKLHYCDKTSQCFYSASANFYPANQELPPSVGLYSSGRKIPWSTAGWRSQYRAPDHACPTIEISKELTGLVVNSGEAVLACAKLLLSSGVAALGRTVDAPSGAVLRVSGQTSAAYDAEALLSSLPEMYLGRSFHELLQACVDECVIMDDFSWEGEWQIGYYSSETNTWKSELAYVQNKVLRINEHSCKLLGDGCHMQCEWFESGVMLRIKHLRPKSVAWVEAQKVVVWARTMEPLIETHWANNLAFKSIDDKAGIISVGGEDALEPWQRQVVRVGKTFKLLRLDVERGTDFSFAAIRVLVLACLLSGACPEEEPPIGNCKAYREYCLRIIIQRYYDLHQWYGPGETEVPDNNRPICLEDELERCKAMQQSMERSLREASVSSAPLAGTQLAALSALLRNRSILEEAKDPRVVHLHSFVRDVAVARKVVNPVEAEKPAVRWATLAEICQMLDLALATPKVKALRAAWLEWLFANIGRPDINDECGGQVAHLALRCPGVSMRATVVPILNLQADVTKIDNQGRSIASLLRARAGHHLKNLEHAGREELIAARSPLESDSAIASDATSIAMAISSIEEDLALGSLWRLTTLSSQRTVWRETLALLSPSDEGIADSAETDGAPPQILTAFSPNGMCEPEGEYVLDPEVTGNGYPVWRKRKGMLYWLYSGKSGKWHLGSNECKNLNFNCDKAFLYRNVLHHGKMPHLIGGCWKRWDGISKKWFDDPDIKITDCPQKLSLGISEFEVALEALYELRPSELNELVAIREPSEQVLCTVRAVFKILHPSVMSSIDEWNTLKEYLSSEDRAIQLLQRILDRGPSLCSASLSEEDSRHVQALMAKHHNLQSVGIGGTRALIALRKWVEAVLVWRDVHETYGQMASERLAKSVCAHITDELAVLQKTMEGCLRSDENKRELDRSLRVLIAAVAEDRR